MLIEINWKPVASIQDKRDVNRPYGLFLVDERVGKFQCRELAQAITQKLSFK